MSIAEITHDKTKQEKSAIKIMKLACPLMHTPPMLREQEVGEEFTAAYLAKELLIDMTSFLLVLIEELPIAKARQAARLLALVLALFGHGRRRLLRLLSLHVVRLFVLDELLIPQEGFAAHLTHKWPDFDVKLIMRVDILDR